VVVNSALQRARATIRDAGVAGGAGGVREAEDPTQRAVVERYARAFEAADVPALVRLLADDAVLEMPPLALWYRGRRHYELFMERVFRMRGTGWATLQLTANGQPALASYAPTGTGAEAAGETESDAPSGGVRRAHSIQVFTVVEGLVASNVVFAGARLFEAFGLPGSLPVE
jgi:RNA polymerase sigma-70 factor (ECF subfamily)